MKISVNQSPQDSDFCPECQIIENQRLDEQNFVLWRGASSLIVLNKKPFNAGHLLIIPINHTNSLLDLKKEQKQVLFEQIDRSIQILQECSNPEGFNVGTNFGKASGAKNPEHFSIEIIPRWTGDANFMASVAQTKPISSNILSLYQNLKDNFYDAK